MNYNASLLEYQVYPEEYFSGSDVSVYLGDVWVDEIASINFTLMEYVEPVFGYNSHLWDAVIRGSRIVQGNFRIAFRETNYLNRIIMTQESISDLEYWRRYTSERVSADEMEDTVAVYQSNPKVFREQLRNKTKEEIKKIAGSLYKQNTPSFENTDPTYFKKKGFDIVVLYGSPLQFAAKKKIYEERFTIPSHAAYKISNVQLGSVTQVMSPDGTPVFEDYQFFARDLEPLE